MFKKLSISIITALAVLGIAGCNSHSEWSSHQVLRTSVAVTAFSLESNSKILNNLDSVFFAIDLHKAEIYNPDSLPLGTDVSRMVVNISTDGVSSAKLQFKSRFSGNDTIVDYMTNSTDSINFSKGAVILTLVSADKANRRDYEIKVNVHKQKSDSLAWGKNSRRNIPSLFSIPADQKTVQAGETLFCISTSGGKYSLATTEHPEREWNISEISFPFTPDLTTLSAVENGTLFILANDGTLYKSSDKCSSWQSTGLKWFHILGGYTDRLLGIQENNGIFSHVTYPATTSTAVETNFPVDGTSQLYVYNNKWMTSPQAIVLGGRNAAGEILTTTWAYDGSEWAMISDNCPAKAYDMTLFPYYETVTDSTNWRNSKADALFALGGLKANGSLQNDVYISKDLGFNWRKAEQVMQMPDYIPARYGAQAFVYTSVLTEDEIEQQSVNDAQWETFEAPALPRWWKIANSDTLAELKKQGRNARAIKPVTEWDTPYIYMFGGYNTYGSLYNTVWRGAINRLTYKPLQ